MCSSRRHSRSSRSTFSRLNSSDSSPSSTILTLWWWTTNWKLPGCPARATRPSICASIRALGAMYPMMTCNPPFWANSSLILKSVPLPAKLVATITLPGPKAVSCCFCWNSLSKELTYLTTSHWSDLMDESLLKTASAAAMFSQTKRTALPLSICVLVALKMFSSHCCLVGANSWSSSRQKRRLNLGILKKSTWNTSASKLHSAVDPRVPVIPYSAASLRWSKKPMLDMKTAFRDTGLSLRACFNWRNWCRPWDHCICTCSTPVSLSMMTNCWPRPSPTSSTLYESLVVSWYLAL